MSTMFRASASMISLHHWVKTRYARWHFHASTWCRRALAEKPLLFWWLMVFLLILF